MARTPTCHPERAHVAKGMCGSCYVTHRRRIKRAKMTEEEREVERAYYREYRKRWRAKNRERDRATNTRARKKARASDPEFHRQRRTGARYGLTVEEYRKLIAPGVCEACGARSDRLQIDHCHETNVVRGALCPGCNTALGHIGDDADRLHRLIAYLKRHSA